MNKTYISSSPTNGKILDITVPLLDEVSYVDEKQPCCKPATIIKKKVLTKYVILDSKSKAYYVNTSKKCIFYTKDRFEAMQFKSISNMHEYFMHCSGFFESYSLNTSNKLSANGDSLFTIPNSWIAEKLAPSLPDDFEKIEVLPEFNNIWKKGNITARYGFNVYEVINELSKIANNEYKTLLVINKKTGGNVWDWAITEYDLREINNAIVNNIGAENVICFNTRRSMTIACNDINMALMAKLAYSGYLDIQLVSVSEAKEYLNSLTTFV